MKLNEEQLIYLKRLIEPARIQTGKEIGEDYSHDELGGITAYPDVLIKVISTEEVSKIMTYAYKQDIPVVLFQCLFQPSRGHPDEKHGKPQQYRRDRALKPYQNHVQQNSGK